MNIFKNPLKSGFLHPSKANKIVEDIKSRKVDNNTDIDQESSFNVEIMGITKDLYQIYIKSIKFTRTNNDMIKIENLIETEYSPFLIKLRALILKQDKNMEAVFENPYKNLIFLQEIMDIIENSSDDLSKLSYNKLLSKLSVLYIAKTQSVINDPNVKKFTDKEK